LRLLREPQHPVSVGVTGDESDTTNFKIARVRPNSPAADAGWDAGDKLLSLGGIRVTPENFLKLVDKYKPGDRVNAPVQRGTKVIQTTIIMGQPQLMTYRIEEMPNASAEAKALRAAWMKNRSQ
jgi:predicted metalloprotease with PDZ domain